MFGRLKAYSEVSQPLDGLYGSLAQVSLGRAEEFGASQRGANDLNEKGAYEEKSTGRFVPEFNPKHSYLVRVPKRGALRVPRAVTSTRGVASAGAASVPPKLGRLGVDTLGWVVLQRRAS